MKYNPLITESIKPLKTYEDLFNDIFPTKQDLGTIPLEVFEEDDSYIVHYYLCTSDKNAVDKKDIDINIKDNNVLTVSLIRDPPAENMLLTNLSYKNVSCSLKFKHITEENVEAAYSEGVLKLKIQKHSLSNKITIN